MPNIMRRLLLLKKRFLYGVYNFLYIVRVGVILTFLVLFKQYGIFPVEISQNRKKNIFKTLCVTKIVYVLTSRFTYQLAIKLFFDFYLMRSDDYNQGILNEC